ncbi:MAG: hypothetical protein ABI785_02835 [Gemmatimonadales bacterium]
MGYFRYFLSHLLLSLSAVALACSGGDLSGPTTGSLEVTTTTTGAEVDPDGYIVQVDAEDPQTIGSSSSFRSAGVTPGNHTIRLAGMGSNCALEGDNPRPVTIAAGETTAVLFQVTCSVTTGNIAITTLTSGAGPDPDGYTVRIDGGESLSIGLNASLELSAVSGPHSVALRDVAPNCNVQGKDPRKVIVLSGRRSSADFVISCSS